jgi:hypothetical protein
VDYKDPKGLVQQAEEFWALHDGCLDMMAAVHLKFQDGDMVAELCTREALAA